jgi:uncharacterized membrane protein YhaH (DUF805 family)
MTETFAAFLKSLFTAQGRSSRGRFWLVIFVLWITLALAGFMIAAWGESILAAVFAIVMLPVVIGGMVAGVFNGVKRLHDLGRSGWWLLLVLVLYLPIALVAKGASKGGPDDQAVGAFLQLIASVIYLAVLGGIPGQRTPNRFGDPPGEQPAPRPSGDPA